MDKNKILAKPSGITLQQHTCDVMREASDICQRLIATCLKYKEIVGKDLQKRLEKSAQIHDLGKEFHAWQDACRKDYLAYMRWKTSHKNCNFNQYSNEVGQYAGLNIRKCGVRHEFHSLLVGEKIKLPLPLQTAIAAHHSKLGYSFKDRWESEGFKKFFNLFLKLSNAVIESDDFPLLTEKSYEFNGIRGLLELADHRASAREEDDNVPQINRYDYVFPFQEKRGVQCLMEKLWDNDILLVRAPTGAGKTDASLLWASKQIEHKRADRLIVAMPTRFTSNALAVSVSKSLSATGLYHSSAWAEIKGSDQNGERMKSVMSQLQNARLLLTPITVCTIDHLLMSLTLTREDHHLIDFNLANSCLVIDEADFYDDFTMANIMFLLKVLKEWKVPVLMMSASLPDSILPVINSSTGYNVKQIYSDETDSQRFRFNLRNKRIYNDFDDIKDLISLCITRGNGIIYMNTIDKAMLCYQYVCKQVEESGKDVDVYLYHSHFTEPDKLHIENKLIDALGKEAWANNAAHGIAILTQIGEMSVNISADIMLSDICPIDRLIQRAGRLCRFNKKEIGDFYLLLPYKNNILYPAPYGEYNLKDKVWEANIFLLSTEKMLTERKYNVSMLTDLLNSIYSGQHDYSNKAKDNAKLLEDEFKYNWLINPVEKASTEQDETMLWKSRDIGSQGVVFIKPPDKKTMCWREFLQYKMKFGIELPVYQLNKARKLHRLDLVGIQIIVNASESIYDQQYINVIREGFYDDKIGLDILKPSNDDIFL